MDMPMATWWSYSLPVGARRALLRLYPSFASTWPAIATGWQGYKVVYCLSKVAFNDVGDHNHRFMDLPAFKI
eukprot:scaffold89242_cov35-Tisochrysis_lutea.AAC.1